MEFVSTDRSRDAEFTRGLQNYNRSVFENNKEIAARIDDSEDQLDKDLSNAQEVADLSNMKTGAALGGLGAGALEKGARAKVEYGKAKIAAREAKAEAEAKVARGGATEVATTATERVAGPGGRFAEDTQLLGDDRAEAAAQEAFNEGQEDLSEARRSGVRPSSPTRGVERPQPEFSEAEQREFRQGLEAGEEGTEGAAEGARGGARVVEEVGEEAIEKAAGGAGKVVGKLAGGLARGAGVAGAALSAGTAIEGLMDGKKFEWNKQGLEIGGALLDIIGTGAEFIPGGQLIGVGLQLAGSAIQGAGAVEEGLDTEPEQAKAEQEAKDLQSKTQADLESAKQQAISRITQAGAGGAAVAREVQ